jgi:hypothetical protein
MSERKKVAVLAMVALLVGATMAGAGDWQKLGSKTLAFKDEPIAVAVETKDASVGEIKFKVGGSWVRFSGLTLNFSDGSSQTIDGDFDVEPGLTSDPIAIDGGPKTIASVEFTCSSAVSARGGRASIAILGQS